VLWLKSFIASAASNDFIASAVIPPIVTAGASAPNAPPKGPADLSSPAAAVLAWLMLPVSFATPSEPVTLAAILRIASKFTAI
jgi:hypothetical protein